MSYDYNKILKTKPLTSEEEVACFERYKNGDKKAFETLVTANLRFVLQVARENMIIGDETSLDDLFEEGTIGLIKAIQKFDHTRGFKLISYGVWWIKQSIKNYIHSRSTIKIAANIKILYNKIVKFEQAYYNKNFIPPTISLIAGEFGITEEKVQNVKQIMNISVSSYDVPVEDGISIVETISETDVVGPTHNEDIKIEVEGLLNKLSSERNKNIIRMYFGLDGEPMTMAGIGEYFEITRSRVEQIINSTLSELKRLGTQKTKVDIVKTIKEVQIKTEKNDVSDKELEKVQARIAKIVEKHKEKKLKEEQKLKEKLEREEKMRKQIKQEEEKIKTIKKEKVGKPITIKDYILGKIFGKKKLKKSHLN